MSAPGLDVAGDAGRRSKGRPQAPFGAARTGLGQIPPRCHHVIRHRDPERIEDFLAIAEFLPLFRIQIRQGLQIRHVQRKLIG
jgi:hypothetical protein